MNSESATDARATLAAWRERGADRIDPVRFRFIEAMAHRAAEQGGNARRLLDDRVAQLVQAYGSKLDRAANAAALASVVEGDLPKAKPRGALGDLLEQVGRSTPPAHSDEIEALEHFREIWTRLSANRRITQSLAKMPENAGPLNSHHLVHRALTLMREVSPDYLHRFMGYVDTLLWIDQANSQLSASAAALSASPRPRKPARGSASR